MSRKGYTYSIIRYVHDVFSGEALNVGVVLSSPDGQIEVRVPSSLVRVKSAFPDADINTIRNALENLTLRLDDAAPTEDFKSLLERALPEDECSLQLSELGVGLTSSLKDAAEHLLDRFVLRCDRDFEHAQVTENKEDKVNWHATSVKQMTSANDDWYHADLQVM
ncbi:DUF3037 domain-containing protein [Frateuria sp. GZRR35]|uniref:DUF3037 domain-containing protein n=1 Tax=Frateuria sp. GZRR35 TaxID=3351536 RepID=UPI003EDCAB03